MRLLSISKIEYAVQWAISIANDDSHGYDQGNRWGPDYDCSSLIITAYEKAGVPVKSNGATYTGNMRSVFKKCGFVEVSSWDKRTTSVLQRGDVILNEANHVEMYIGNGQMVKASENEFHGAHGGKTGDQTGQEIKVGGFYIYPSGWDCALRYTGGGTTNASISSSDSKISKFIQTAKSHVGDNGQWTWTTLGWKGEWCCAFIMACASTVGGLLDIIIPKTYSCTNLAQCGGKNKFGSKFISGPKHNAYVKPSPGDLVLFNTGSASDLYTSTHVGIVYDVSGDVIYTIEGNTGSTDMNASRVSTKEWNYRNSSINGYFRPNWNAVGSSVSDLSISMINGSLFSTQNTKYDASIREVGYISNGKPTTKSSEIKLSVVNYTTVLSSMFSGYSIGSDSCDVIVDGIEDGNARTIISYLLTKNLNAACACGICGNIYRESGYRPDAVNPISGASGICQWYQSRKTSMIKFVGSDWKSNMTGQLDYLWSELNGSYYSNILEYFKTVSNTESGAKSSADYFLRHFESPEGMDAESKIRQAKASELYGKLVIQQKSSNLAFSSGTMTSQTGVPVAGGTEIVIPSYVKQAGISDIYTNYSYFYPKWARSSNQYQIAQIWGKLGKKSNRNIATINNYYLIAVKPIFGKVGDVLTVVLNDGTSFNAIMADAKGTENGTSGYALYGHGSNGNVNIIEWEAVGSETSVYTGNTHQRDLSGWSGKTVSKIINRGTWLK
nr:MAG TPA: NlpC/P60 family [Caudoviricetes sp.]